MHHCLPKVKKSWFKITKKGRVLHCLATMVGCVGLAGPATAGNFTISTPTDVRQSLESNETGIITDTGSITVADQIGVLVNGSGVTLNNAGSITVSSEDFYTFGIGTGDLDQATIHTSGSIIVNGADYVFGVSLRDIFESSFDNSGSITVTGEGSHGASAGFMYNSSLTNSGTITVTGDEYSRGISSGELFDGSTITNSGLISAHMQGGGAVGIWQSILHDNTAVFNTGTIDIAGSSSPLLAGIANSASSHDSNITNDGTINVTGTGYTDYNAGIYSRHCSGTIANSGNITLVQDNAHSYMAAGIQIIYGYNPTISNTGTITMAQHNSTSWMTAGVLTRYGSATINNSGTIILTQDNSNSFAGGIFAIYGATSISNSGTITLVGDNSNSLSAGGIIANGNTPINNSGIVQALNNDGSISNNNFAVFTNYGSLENQSHGILKGRLFVGGSVDNDGSIFLPGLPSSSSFSSYSGQVGNLVNSGTLGITLSDNNDSAGTSYSILMVLDDAQLDNGSTINVDIKSASHPMVGQTLEGIIRASSITADTSLINTTDNSALLKFTPVLSHEDTWLDLNIEQDLTILQASTSAGKTGVLGTAGALDSLTDSDDPDLSSFIGELYTYETDEEVAQGVVEASPVNATTSPTVVNAVLNTMSSVVQARLQSVRGFNSGDQLFSDRNLWVKPVGAHMDQDSRDGINGFSANTYGLGLGADGEYSTGRQFGLAFFYTGVDVDSKGVSQDNDLQVFNLMAYGSNPLLDESTELFYQAGGGLQSTDSRRDISAADATAKADYTSKSLFAQLKATKTLYPSDKLKTMLGLGLSYMYYYNPSYHESGAGGLNLDVDSFDSNALVASLEGDLIYDLGRNFRLLASAAIGCDLIDDDTSVTSNFQVDNSVVFATEGIDNSPFIFKLGAGIATNIQDNISVDLKYDLDGRSSDFLNHVVTAQLNWKF